MSGHSKWSKIKHQKAGNDANKGLVFTKLGNAITIAVKEGGGITDPESNFKLRLAVEKARAANMPKENINRAIDRGSGKNTENSLEEVIYEGYGPFGVAVLIEALTDNRARTSSLIKSSLDKAGGKLGEPGSVGFLFQPQGLIAVESEGKDSEEIMMQAIDLGASDVEISEDGILIYTKREDLIKIKNELEKLSLKIAAAEEIKKPVSVITLEKKEDLDRITALIDKLEEMEDVQAVHSNYDQAESFSA